MAWGCQPEGEQRGYATLFNIIGHEQKGSGDSVLVVDVRGQAMTIPKADFPDKLIFVKGYKPPPLQ
jgi:hypothetical protein